MTDLDVIERRRLIASLRDNMLFFGIDTRHLSDDELVRQAEEVQRRVSQAAAQIGATMQEAADALRKLGEAMAKVDTAEFFRHYDKDTLPIWDLEPVEEPCDRIEDRTELQGRE